MADIVDHETRSRMMSRIRGRDTVPELIVRRHLHRHGLRFRLHVAGMPGRPDIVLTKHRTVVEVRGCFWHAHPGCRYAVMPKTRREFWQTKLRGNIERDRRNEQALRDAGWRVLIVWECETGRPDRLDELVHAIRGAEEQRNVRQ